MLIACLVFGGAACSWGESAKKDPGTPAAASPGENTSEGVDEEEPEIDEAPEVKSRDAKASREQIEAKDASQTGLGPTDTLRAFNDAVLKKDAPKIRSFLSRGSMKMIEESAREQGRPVDDILTADDGAPMPVEREMQNEVIDGDQATVEVKNSVLGSFDKMILVKEDGNWRIALDKIQEAMIRKLNELQKNAPKVN
ncbi:MAG: nuclear transport factor 2 family protein [Acidobacteriota bacterium]|nr:nuclear transport factor 2 family protein [Acidobacteriota bacterium]